MSIGFHGHDPQNSLSYKYNTIKMHNHRVLNDMKPPSCTILPRQSTRITLLVRD